MLEPDTQFYDHGYKALNSICPQSHVCLKLDVHGGC